MSSGVTFSYDPLGRLTRYGSTAQTRFLYDGVEIVGEYKRRFNQESVLRIEAPVQARF